MVWQSMAPNLALMPAYQTKYRLTNLGAVINFPVYTKHESRLISLLSVIRTRL